MRRSRFRDLDFSNSRIDSRTGEARANGYRNVHRDMSGEIIGATSATGVPLGTKKQTPATSLTPRLDAGPNTPGLDRWHAANDNPAPRPSFAAQDAAARKVSAASGAFGKGAQNLAGRQALHAEMKAAGQSGITPDMESRAKKLGISGPSWRRVAGAVPQTPAMLAAKPAPTSPVPPLLARTPQTTQPSPAAPLRPPAAPAAPQFGKAVAQANIATKGTLGAVADYQTRSAAEKTLKAQSKWRTAAVMPPAAKAMTPITGQRTEFRATAGMQPPITSPISAAPQDQLKKAGFRSAMNWQTANG